MKYNELIQQQSPKELIIPDGMLDELCAAYSKPKRFYHTIDHVMEVLSHVQGVDKERGWENPKEIFLATLYHDAIYEFGAKDNEAQSAEMARKSIHSWLGDQKVDLDYVSQLIRLTAKHGKISTSEISEEVALFLDCDMAILGSSRERFIQYEEEIKLEYTQVYPAFAYRLGRKKFLKGLLKAPRIYLSEYFHQKLGKTALRNVKSALG